MHIDTTSIYTLILMNRYGDIFFTVIHLYTVPNNYMRQDNKKQGKHLCRAKRHDTAYVVVAPPGLCASRGTNGSTATVSVKG